MRAFAALAVGIAAASSGLADTVEGEISLGYRNAAVSGSRAKYDEDVNLDDGARLVAARFALRPDAAGPMTPDLLELDARNLGGDPFESATLDIRKYGAYSFRASRRRSAWFYDDIIVLPEDASIEGSTAGDFHRFDVERVHDEVSLAIEATERAQLSVGFDRQRKTGDSTTTLDISRDEFELESRVDETLESWRFGARYRWPSVRLSLEERIRDYENLGERVLPGFSVGENPDNLTTVDFYFLDEPYRFRSYEHTARVHVEPGDRFAAALTLLAGDLDLDTDLHERAQGTDFMGNPFTTETTGGGSIDRDSTAQVLDLSLIVNDRVSLVAGARRSTLDQGGDIVFGPAEGGTSHWDIENRAWDLGVTWALRDNLTLAAGWRHETRDVDAVEQQAGAESRLTSERTDGDGVYLALDFRPLSNLDLSIRLNDRQIDDPFSLASPSDASRLKFRARWRADNGLSATVSYALADLDNDLADWSTESRQTSLRLSYSNDRLLLSAGVTRADTDRDYRRLVTGGGRQDLFDVADAAETSYDDLQVRWSFDERLAIGAAVLRYDNDGSFPVRRDDRRLFLAAGITDGYAIEVSWRDIDYEEGNIEAYDAGLFEAVLKLGF